MNPVKIVIRLLILILLSSVSTVFADRARVAGGFDGSAVHNPKTNLFLAVSRYEKLTTSGYSFEHKRGIQAHLVSPSGNRLGVEIPIYENATTMAPFLSKPDIAYNSIDNEYLIVWSVLGIEPEEFIYVQRMGPYGSLIGAKRIVANYFPSMSNPKVSFNSIDGYYIICWETDSEDINGMDIQAKRLGRNGDARPNSSFSITSKRYDQKNMDIVYNENANEFMAVWQDDHASSGRDSDIYARRLNGSGTISNDFPVSWDDENSRYNPSVSFNSKRNAYFAVWDYRYSPKERDIFGRFIAPTGSMLSDEIFLSEPDHDEQQPDISVNTSNGDMLVVWRGNEVGGILVDKEGAQKRMIAGLPTHPLKCAFNPNQQTFLVTWSNGRGLWVDLYDMLLDKDGYSTNLVHIKTRNGHYFCAENGGGQEVNATRNRALAWETFSIIDLNNGVLQSGDQVYIRTFDGHYVTAENGGGSILSANRTTPRQWETFKIIKADGEGEIHIGDLVAFQAQNGDYISAEGAGGGDTAANRQNVGPWETHILISADKLGNLF